MYKSLYIIHTKNHYVYKPQIYILKRLHKNKNHYFLYIYKYSACYVDARKGKIYIK